MASAKLPWLETALRSEELMNCTLKASGGERRFPAHKLILSLRSRVFRRLLDPADPLGKGNEGKEPVEISGVLDTVLEIAIAFIYGKRLKVNTFHVALDVAKFGRRMKITGHESDAVAIVCEMLKHSIKHMDFFVLPGRCRMSWSRIRTCRNSS